MGSIDIESALAGEYGEEIQQAAEKAVRGAIDQVAAMFKHAGPMTGGGGVATGGVFSGAPTSFRISNGECVLPKGHPFAN